MKNKILSIILLLSLLTGVTKLMAQPKVESQQEPNQIFKAEYTFKKQSYLLVIEKVQKGNQLYHYRIENKQDSTLFCNFSTLDIDRNVFGTQFRPCFIRVVDPLENESDKMHYLNHEDQVFYEIYNHYEKIISSNTPMAGKIIIAKDFNVQPQFKKEIWVPRNSTELIDSIDSINVALDRAFKSIDFYCHDTSNCDVVKYVFELYKDLFDDKEYYYQISGGKGRSININYNLPDSVMNSHRGCSYFKDKFKTKGELAPFDSNTKKKCVKKTELQKMFIGKLQQLRYLREMKVELNNRCYKIEETKAIVDSIEKERIKNEKEKKTLDSNLTNLRSKFKSAFENLKNVMIHYTCGVFKNEKLSTNIELEYNYSDAKGSISTYSLLSPNKSDSVMNIVWLNINKKKFYLPDINAYKKNKKMLDSIITELDTAISQQIRLITSYKCKTNKKYDKPEVALLGFQKIIVEIFDETKNGFDQMIKLDSIRSEFEKANSILTAQLSNQRNRYQYAKPRFVVDSVQIEFSAGTIKNIIVEGIYEGKPYKLINYYPIPFSALADIETHQHILLYEPDEYRFTASLSDILDYIPHLLINSEDYSPEDHEYTFRKDAAPQILFKEKSVDILKGRIFTDFMGIAGDQPNGLIQTEVSKRINIYTRYRPLFYKAVGKRPGYQMHYGLLNYMEPSLLISKIENNNRNTLVGTSLGGDKFVSTLNLLKYSFFNFKPVSFNFLSFHQPTMKVSVYWDLGASWLMTSALEKGTPDINTTVHSTIFNTALHFQVKPDTRYGFTLTNDFLFLKSWSKNIQQAGDSTNFMNGSDVREFNWIYNVQFNAYYRPFKKDLGDLFFRFSYYTLIQDPSQNFMQTQLGIIFRIIKN